MSLLIDSTFIFLELDPAVFLCFWILLSSLYAQIRLWVVVIGLLPLVMDNDLL